MMNRSVPVFVTAALGLVFAGGCAGQKKAENPLAGPAYVNGNSVQFPYETVQKSSDAALVESISTACEGLCDRVFLTIGPDAEQTVIEKAIDAAAQVKPAPRLTLMPPSEKPVEVSLIRPEPQACPTTVVIEDEAMAVAYAGEPAEPDITCERWNSVICRGDEGYDWPRLRTVVGKVSDVCVHVAIDGAGAAIDTLNELLMRPTIQFVAPMSVQGSLDEAAAKEAVALKQADFDWCYRQVLEDDPPADVVLKILVDHEGEVARAEVVNAVRSSAQFEKCITEAVEDVRFSEPGGLAVVEVPVEPSEK